MPQLKFLGKILKLQGLEPANTSLHALESLSKRRYASALIRSIRGTCLTACTAVMLLVNIDQGRYSGPDRVSSFSEDFNIIFIESIPPTSHHCKKKKNHTSNLNKILLPVQNIGCDVLWYMWSVCT